MGVRHKHLVDEIIFFSRSSLLATAPTALCTVLIQGLGFDIAGVR